MYMGLMNMKKGHYSLSFAELFAGKGREKESASREIERAYKQCKHA